MTITKEIWLKATAEAMSTEACKELFANDSTMEDLFTDYSFSLFQLLSGKTLKRVDFIKEVGDFSAELLKEIGMGTTNVLVNIALMCFANQIWKNMANLAETERISKEYDNFRGVLKSQKSE